MNPTPTDLPDDAHPITQSCVRNGCQRNHTARIIDDPDDPTTPDLGQQLGAVLDAPRRWQETTRRLEQQTNLLTALAADIRTTGHLWLTAGLDDQQLTVNVAGLLRTIAGRIDLALEQPDQEETGWPEVVHPAEHQTRQEPEPARCSWCFDLARGTATNRTGRRFPACGAPGHGTTYVAEGDPVVDQEPAR